VLGAFDEAREERESASSFERQVAGSLTLCSRVGNIYTGSLYLGFAGMLNAGAPTLAGKRIGLFSYGSGCASEFFSGIVGKNAAEQIQRARLDEVIGSRERVTVEEYERLMALPPRRRLTFLPPPVGSASPACRPPPRDYAAADPAQREGGPAGRRPSNRRGPGRAAGDLPSSRGLRRAGTRPPCGLTAAPLDARRATPVAGAARFWHRRSHLWTPPGGLPPPAARGAPFVEARRLLSRAAPECVQQRVSSCDGSTQR
jgi:hypothetical protein